MASLLIGTTARPSHAALAAAARFIDQSAYEDRVLNGASPLPPAVPDTPGRNALRGAIGVAAGLALAFAVVLQTRRRRRRGFAAAVGSAIRDLHSGHVGDYIAWLTCGAAILSAAAILFCRTRL